MIKKVGKGIKNGDIIEFNQNSEPLFLYHDGDLIKLTPAEYNHLIVVTPEERYWELKKFRKKWGMAHY